MLNKLCLSLSLSLLPNEKLIVMRSPDEPSIYASDKVLINKTMIWSRSVREQLIWNEYIDLN